jgi:hypothetical protein
MACAVYDETLLSVGRGAETGGSSGTAAGAGGQMTQDGSAIDESSAGGAGGDASVAPDAHHAEDSARGDVSSDGAAGSNVVDSPVALDSVRDISDAAARPDMSMTPQCPLLIDNMESMTGHVLDACRNGFWFTYNENADVGTQQPAVGAIFNPTAIVPPRGASTYAAHTSGGGHAYAGLGFNLNSPPGVMIPATYDASAYVGITFFAMGTGTVIMVIPDKDTNPQGGVCMTGDRAQCFDHFSSSRRPIVLTSAWQPYTVLFSDLVQQGFGYRAPAFDKSAIYAVQWLDNAAGAAFDIWIDDVSFITSVADAGGQ